MASPPADTVVVLFTDIEGSTRLWEQEPKAMPYALERHDALVRAAVADHRGKVVKMLGDGVHAAFDDPVDAVGAALQMQQSLAHSAATHGIALRIRCGLNAGVAERRDNDLFGGTVNRAARIMDAAHGGQVLLSETVASLIRERLPAGVALRDLGTVRLRDLSSAERVHQLVHPTLRQEFPALRSLSATPNNLPQQVTSFVGRERGLAEVKDLLGETRLLTLLGMGGLGKTRLSLQTAAGVLDDYEDGVWFVELASVADARLVPQAVASVLGVMEEAGRPVLEALVKFVRDRQLLVILDNCEHLVNACADLAKQLLQAGSGLKVLTSSREPLRLAGETTYPVPALALPEANEEIAMDTFLRYDGVRLFVDRAVAMQPSFKVTKENAAALAEICQRLDGIPLAIELAAARLRTLSVKKIAERLGDRFRLLTGGDRTALPRQQTLRALIDWSHDLLTDDEKSLFARLSVFAGGFTMEAAEVVGAGGAIEGVDVLDLLTSLVEKSLIELEASGERYRLLETVRQYAQEKLDASGEADKARTLHLDCFLAFAKKVQPELYGAEQGKWLARLDLERENILAAHAWCGQAPGEAERGLHLVTFVQLYWLPRGLMELGYRVTAEALARPGAQARAEPRRGALYAASQIAYFMGAFEKSKAHAAESVAIAREIAETKRLADALIILGYARDALGEAADAQACFEESLTIARSVEDKGRQSFALNALAGHKTEIGEWSAALPLLEEAVEIARELSDRESVAIGLPVIANIVNEQGSPARACSLLLESLQISQEIGSARAGHYALKGATEFAAFRAEWAMAARLFGALEAQREQLGLRDTPSDEAHLGDQIAKAREALGNAAFAAAKEAGRLLSFDDALTEARAWLSA